MDNLIVTVELATPIIIGSQSYITLDAVLAAALFRRYGDIQRAHSEIPLDRSDGIWHGSAAFFPVHCRHERIHFIRGLRMDDLGSERHLPAGRRHAKFDNVRGLFKWEETKYEALHAPKATFFCRGDAERITDLLGELPGLGKKTNSGYGQILGDPKICAIVDDHSIVLPDETPARPVPAPIWQAITGRAPEQISEVVWEPPYWNEKNRSPCALPLSCRKQEHELTGVASLF